MGAVRGEPIAWGGRLLRGRPGMVAFSGSADLCRPVLLRCPIGRLSLVEGGPSEPCWQAWSLRRDDAHEVRDIQIPDAGLTPLAVLPDQYVGRVAKYLARMDFELALEDLRDLLRGRQREWVPYEVQIEGAVHWALAERMLQVVPTALALTEVGFKACQSGNELVWSPQGDSLQLAAVQEERGRWLVSASGRGEGAGLAGLPGRVLLAQRGVRGALVAKVRELSCRATGRSDAPMSLKVGHDYERHRRMLIALGVSRQTVD